MRGPGAMLKTIASENPNTEITSPNTEDLTMAIHNDGASCNPNKVGVDSKAITRITPTVDIELTITRAIVKPRAKFTEDTFAR